MPETAILPPKQPMINRRLYRRGIIAIILIAVIGIILYIIQTVRDIDLPTQVNTVGDIAAIQYSANGSQAVLIKPDGSIVKSNGYSDGMHDRDPVWRPDGNRIYFVSDREPNQINLYRWNPGSGRVERRTSTNGAYTNLIYSGKDPSSGEGLVAMGGMIVKFDPVTGDTSPVLPPVIKDSESNNSENGRVSSIEASLFSGYGTSFKEACYFGGDHYVACVMGGENGEILLIQDMRPLPNGQFSPPQPVIAGDAIDIDYNRHNGSIVFAMKGFRFPDPDHIPPEYVKGGKVVPPVEHVVGMLDASKINPDAQIGTLPVPPITIVASQNNKNVFGDPVISPDGNSLVVSVGIYNGDGLMDMKGLLVMPMREGGGAAASQLHKGVAEQLSYSGDGKTIAYVERRTDGSNVIHTMGSDGSNDKAITEGKGSFGQPKFSPQQ
jgi:hypothetical protein